MDMEVTMEQLSKLQKAASTFGETTSKVKLGDLFRDSMGSCNEKLLFIAHFNNIPNYDYLCNINCENANDWFLSKYEKEIKDCHFATNYYKRHLKTDIDDIFYLIYKDLLVHFTISKRMVTFLFRYTPICKIQEIIEGLKKFKMRTQFSKPQIGLLVNSPSGFQTHFFPIPKPQLTIDDNYNSDFKDIHQIIQKRLSKRNDKGLVLLHGKPGTGKTSYIRYLLASVRKTVIFLPPNLAAAITNPELITFLIKYHNCIFVIEDAENIVVDREKNGVSPVSALLNISDGLLSDCLNIQIICSFNTDITKVDSALLRKGRLIAQYEFKELETTKAQALSNKLAFNSIITRPMTLTEIYNQDEQDFTAQKQRKSIGFGAR